MGVGRKSFILEKLRVLSFHHCSRNFGPQRGGQLWVFNTVWNTVGFGSWPLRETVWVFPTNPFKVFRNLRNSLFSRKGFFSTSLFKASRFCTDFHQAGLEISPIFDRTFSSQHFGGTPLVKIWRRL